jgi:Na+/proline symporter
MLLLAIALYVLAQLALAVFVARDTKSEADYLVAGRGLGTFPVAMSIFATWFAAETIIATAGETAGQGLPGARVEPFGYTVGILALALMVAVKLRREGVLSLAGFLGHRFGDRVGAVSAVLVAVAATVWAGAQLSALATLLSEAGDFPFILALVIGTGVVLLYTWVGGLKGDVATDVVQGLVLVVCLIVIFALVMNEAGGFQAALSSVPPERWQLNRDGESWLGRGELWVLPIFGTITSQEAISRVLGARSVKVARNGALLGAGIYLAAGMIPVFLGLVGPSIGIGLSRDLGDAYFPALAQAVLPAWAYVILSGALLSAILSSVDSALLAVSGVTTEVKLSIDDEAISAKRRLRLARTITIIAGLAAFTIALLGESLRAIVLLGSGISGLLTVPLLAGLFLPSSAPRSIVAALIASIGIQAVSGWILDWDGAFIAAITGGALVFAAAEGFARFRPGPTRFRGSPGATGGRSDQNA